MKVPFEQVVRRHGATVLRVCRAVLGPHDAQDAWAETFLSALRAYPDLPGDANVEAWLVRIAHHKCIDVTRAARRRATPVADVPDQGGGDPAERGSYDLWAALGALPRKQREVLAYRHLGGIGYREIAEIVGGTPEAARRAASDGISALRRVLGADVASMGGVS